MKREELLKALSATPFCAVPTVVTYDSGLQYDYMSSEGAGAGFGGMGCWPAFLFEGISQKKWNSIRRALRSNSLRSRTLQGTELLSFWKTIRNDYYGGQFRRIGLNSMFANLLTLPETVPNQLFAIFDLEDGGYEDYIPDFFTDEITFFDEFESRYCTYYDSWEDMSDEELMSWYERLTGDMEEFPFNLELKG